MNLNLFVTERNKDHPGICQDSLCCYRDAVFFYRLIHYHSDFDFLFAPVARELICFHGIFQSELMRGDRTQIHFTVYL